MINVIIVGRYYDVYRRFGRVCEGFFYKMGQKYKLQSASRDNQIEVNELLQIRIIDKRSNLW